ncbi:hypothetical protein EW146_g7999, partial [Bondarzewia mesenterica]
MIHHIQSAPEEDVQPLIKFYYHLGLPDTRIAVLVLEHFDESIYGIGTKSIQRLRKKYGLLSTRQQKHTLKSIAAHVDEIKKRFPNRGADSIHKALRQEKNIRVPRDLISEYLKLTEPDAVAARRHRQFRRDGASRLLKMPPGCPVSSFQHDGGTSLTTHSPQTSSTPHLSMMQSLSSTSHSAGTFSTLHFGTKQYLAVGSSPSSTHSLIIGVKASRPSNACIQICSLGPAQVPKVNGDAPDGTKLTDAGEMNCEMILCIDSTPAYGLKWCHLLSHVPLAEPKTSLEPPKPGLSKGHSRTALFRLRSPISSRFATRSFCPTICQAFRTEPLLRIELEEASCWTIEWANSEVIAVDCMNGTIAVYDIGDALRTGRSSSQRIFPTQYMLVHQSAIRALSWIRTPKYSSSNEPLMADDPSVIATGGYDGVESHGHPLIDSIPFSPYAGGPVTIDHENIMKTYLASSSMLGRGHTLMELSGPVW